MISGLVRNLLSRVNDEWRSFNHEQSEADFQSSQDGQIASWSVYWSEILYITLNYTYYLVMFNGCLYYFRPFKL